MCMWWGEKRTNSRAMEGERERDTHCENWKRWEFMRAKIIFNMKIVRAFAREAMCYFWQRHFPQESMNFGSVFASLSSSLSLSLFGSRAHSRVPISWERRWFRNWHTAQFCHFPNREVPHSHFNSFKILLWTIPSAWSTFYSLYELFNSIKGVNSSWKTD